MVYLLIILAAFFKAVMDRTGHEVQFNASVFNKLNPKFWLKTVSWEYAYIIPFTKYKVDAWHLAGTGMISFFLLIIPLYQAVFVPWLDFIFGGLLYNEAFNLFYHHLLKRKKTNG